MHLQEGLGEMQRRRQTSGSKNRRPPTRLDEIELAVKLNLIKNMQPPVEVQQIDTTPQQNMLAVVDGLAGRAASGFFFNDTATTEKRAGFEEIDLIAGVSKRRSRSHP